jgi:hypothetical protein
MTSAVINVGSAVVFKKLGILIVNGSVYNRPRCFQELESETTGTLETHFSDVTPEELADVQWGHVSNAHVKDSGFSIHFDFVIPEHSHLARNAYRPPSFTLCFIRELHVTHNLTRGVKLIQRVWREYMPRSKLSIQRRLQLGLALHSRLGFSSDLAMLSDALVVVAMFL